MFHYLPNTIEIQKTANKIHLTLVTIGGGGQDGKWSHFPPLFFLNPSLTIVEPKNYQDDLVLRLT